MKSAGSAVAAGVAARYLEVPTQVNAVFEIGDLVARVRDGLILDIRRTVDQLDGKRVYHCIPYRCASAPEEVYREDQLREHLMAGYG